MRLRVSRCLNRFGTRRLYHQTRPLLSRYELSSTRFIAPSIGPQSGPCVVPRFRPFPAKPCKALRNSCLSSTVYEVGHSNRMARSEGTPSPRRSIRKQFLLNATFTVLGVKERHDARRIRRQRTQPTSCLCRFASGVKPPLTKRTKPEHYNHPRRDMLWPTRAHLINPS